MSNRRKDLVKAAETAFINGEITRADLLKIRFASLSPAVMNQIEQTAQDQIAFENKLTTNANGFDANIDWISLFKELLPIILQLIKLFA